MGEVICPYCKEVLQEGAVIRCLQCRTRHHSICWLEYGNHCSVFSCQGKHSTTGRKTESSILLIAWCLMNYTLHLALRFVGQLTGPVPLADVFIVGLTGGSHNRNRLDRFTIEVRIRTGPHSRHTFVFRKRSVRVISFLASCRPWI